MQKLILSIIAVAFLQIGFITYVTTNQTADNARLTGIKTQPVNPVGNPTYSSEDENIEVANLDEDPFFRREKADFRIARAARFVKGDYTTRRRSTRMPRKSRTQPEPFVPEQVIITYAVHKPYKFAEREPYKNVSVYNEPILDKPETSEQPLSKPQKSDDKTLLTIIKKPYSWIKALGSKLK